MRDYPAIARQYCEQVVAGEIVAGKWIKLACRRYLRDFERAATDPDWPYRFDDWEASNVCSFIEALPHVEGRWASPKTFCSRHCSQTSRYRCNDVSSNQQGNPEL